VVKDVEEAEEPEEAETRRGPAKSGKRKGRPPGADAAPPRRSVTVTDGITVQEFAELTRRPVGIVVRELVTRGQMAGATQPIPSDLITVVGDALGYDVTVEAAAQVEAVEAEPLVRPKQVHEEDESKMEPRPPVVTVMGHVDHGKTQLLDSIRRTDVVAGEAGGITQHIGAYQATLGDRKITFIDTPGHEAFTTLRARGAEVTDIVVLVVAADDGVMPQTVEAISHAKAAKVPIVVAVNKMDLETADPHAVRAQLTEHGLVVEQLGGDVVSAEVSALTGDGIDQLLEVHRPDRRAGGVHRRPDRPGVGHRHRGSARDRAWSGRHHHRAAAAPCVAATSIVAGPVSGRVRAMFDENGNQVDEAGPSTPVLVMGWAEVPVAGDYFEAVEDDKTARAKAAERVTEMRDQELFVPSAADRLGQLLEDLRTADDAELPIIVKADAHGSLEAIRDGVAKIGREGGKVTIIHLGVGGITENDVLLADTTGAIIFGFNVRPDTKSRKAAEAAGHRSSHLPDHLRAARRHRGHPGGAPRPGGGRDHPRDRGSACHVPRPPLRHDRRLLRDRG
jgi:translation initiation factor IF-2